MQRRSPVASISSHIPQIAVPATLTFPNCLLYFHLDDVHVRKQTCTDGRATLLCALSNRASSWTPCQNSPPTSGTQCISANNHPVIISLPHGFRIQSLETCHQAMSQSRLIALQEASTRLWPGREDPQLFQRMIRRMVPLLVTNSRAHNRRVTGWRYERVLHPRVSHEARKRLLQRFGPRRPTHSLLSKAMHLQYICLRQESPSWIYQSFVQDSPLPQRLN